MAAERPYPRPQTIKVDPIQRPSFALDTVAQTAYWTGRLSSALEGMLDQPGAVATDVARSCLDEFTEWRDSLVPS